MNVKTSSSLNENIIKPYVGKNRIFAGLIDWIIGGIFSGLPSVFAFSMLTNSDKALTSMYQFESVGFSRYITIGVATICLLFGFVYYVVIPWIVWPGQTLGKRIMKLKIVKQDGTKLDLSNLFIRQFIFLILVEGMFTATSTYVKVLITTISRFYVDSYLTIIWSILTLSSAIILFLYNKHLAIHDVVTNTTVVLNENE